MTGLPARFPKAMIHRRLSDLETKINILMDETQLKIDYAEDNGLGQVTQKLAMRHEDLDYIRQLVYQAKLQAFYLK